MPRPRRARPAVEGDASVHRFWQGLSAGGPDPSNGAMTPRMHLSPTARTAGAALLTTVLIASPVVAPATAHSPVPPAQATGAQAAELTASPQLGGSAHGEGRDLGDGARLGASQEGTWFLGRSVDSVLGPGQWYTAEQGRTWYGAYRTFPDGFAYCVDAGLRTPHPRHFDDDAEGEAIDSARSAWALAEHSASDSPDVQAALSALVRLDEDIPHRHQIPPGHPADLGADFAGAAEQFAAIEEDAARLAGPYTLSVDIRARTFRALDGQHGPPLDSPELDRATTNRVQTDSRSTDSASTAGSEPSESASDGDPLTAAFPLEAVVSLTSASGEAVPGQRVHLSATGARTAVDSIVSAEEPTVVSLTDLEDGSVTVDASATGLPATSVELHRPRGLGSDRVQAVVTAGEPTKATARAVHDRPQEPEESEETDPPRAEAPKPRPTTLPTPSPTPEEPTPTGTPERTTEPTDEPTTPEEEPPPAPSDSPEPSPTPEVPETPEPPAPPETPEATGTPETTQPPETPQVTDEPGMSPGPEETPRPEDTGPPADSAPPLESEPPAPPAPEQPPAEPRDDAADEPVPSSLPRTGAESVAALGLAIVLISVGVAALAFTRRG